MTRGVRYLGFGTVTVLTLFLILELLLRLLISVSVDWTHGQGELTHEFKLWQMRLFDSFMGMHQSDPQLFWRMKPNYHSSFVTTNSLGFAGPEPGPKKPGDVRVLFLGDSTPLGIGLSSFDDSFVFQLQRLLDAALPDRKIEIINAATAGYSSWQCRRQLELMGEQLQPDIVVTYFGNNDPSLNGFLSDRELSDLAGGYAGLKRLLSKSYIYTLMKFFLLRWRASLKESQEVKERVPLADFAENLRAIHHWCDQHQCRLLLCTIPTPDLWPPGIQFKVFSQGRDDQGRLVMSEQMRRDLGANWALCLDTLLLPGRHDFWTERVYAGAFADTGDLVIAERFYRAELRQDPTNAKYLNNLGVLRWRQQQDSEEYFRQAMLIDSLDPVILYNLGIATYRTEPQRARLYLERAKELDHYSLRIKAAYNDSLAMAGKHYQIGVVDLVGLLDSLPENQYFVDHCHPTLAGHKLIAGRLLTAISRIVAVSDPTTADRTSSAKQPTDFWSNSS